MSDWVVNHVGRLATAAGAQAVLGQGEERPTLTLPLAIVAAVIGVPVLVRRYQTISSVFEDGTEAQGTVTSLSFFRGRGRVQYSYTFQGEKQSSDNAINKNGRTRKLRVGQKVTVLVDRNNPKQAFIRDIYL